MKRLAMVIELKYNHSADSAIHGIIFLSLGELLCRSGQNDKQIKKDRN